MSKSEKIRDAILKDITDRRGWRQEWDQFDGDVQNEIRSTWLNIIEKIVEPEGLRS